MLTYTFENILCSSIKVQITACSYTEAEELLEYAVSEFRDCKLVNYFTKSN